MNLSKPVMSFAALAAATALRADPMKVTDVSMVQDSGNTTLTVSYTLVADAPAFVRLDILTNQASIGLENIKTVSGDGFSADFDSFVSPGKHQLVWQARKDWPEHVCSNAQARVLAYYTNLLACVKGVYMVVDLSRGPSAASYPVSYTLNAPAPLTDPTCASNHLWLKRVEPGTFVMGSPTNELGGYRANEGQHDVELTEAFFTGVFPVTQAQYALVMGTNVPTGQAASSPDALCPANKLSYAMIRGSMDEGIDWPNTGTNVLTSGFLGLLRGKTSGLIFDFPTEAQWEYACRAGTTGAWNNGTTITDTAYDPNLLLLGWFGDSTAVGQGNATSAMPVGRKRANAWGLYDCHGNVWEWCLDWRHDILAELADANKDPAGGTSGTVRVLRGGSWGQKCYQARSAYRYGAPQAEVSRVYGFRLACRLGF